MKLVCAYVSLSPNLERFLWSYTTCTFLYRCREWWDYYDALKRHWSIGDSFINIEQDILPTHAALTDLWDCREGQGWCTQPYRARASGQLLTDALGCTKFADYLLQHVGKGLFDRIEQLPKERVYVSGKHWQYLDIWVRDLLKESGVVPHVHGIEVEHESAEPVQ